MTSVSLWDGPEGTYGELILDLFDQSGAHGASGYDTEDPDYIVIPPDPVGSTYNTTSNNYFESDTWRTAFGFQIHPSKARSIKNIDR